MTVYEKKESFVANELSAMLKKIVDNVASVDYFRANYGDEFVVINYDNNYSQSINVTADSLYAIAIDVLRLVG